MASTTPTSSAAPSRWPWLVAAGVLLVVGWLFILWNNSFHPTAPVVFVCLGYFAGISAIYTLFRTGAAAVSEVEEDDAEAWGRPEGARAELQREKRALLKAIKEAEFDRDMGKLSERDASQMIATYRARAIEVIKEIDRLDGAGGASVQDEIEREVRARLAMPERKGGKAKPAEAKAGGKGKDAKAAKDAKAEKSEKAKSSAAKADATAADAKSDAKAVDANATAESEPASDSDSDADADSDSDSDSDSKHGADTPAPSEDEPAEVAPHDAGAESTAKEATP
ncbi:MAG: hypothetical protein ACTHU0_20510 [Kofleriaceae bacterium]